MAQTFNCSPKCDTEDAPNKDMNSNENVSWSAINVDWRKWEEYCLIQVLAEADEGRILQMLGISATKI